jgi:hypothetical protein
MSDQELSNRELSNQEMSKQAPTRRFSLDAWAVVLALIAVFLVRFGLIKHISW